MRGRRGWKTTETKFPFLRRKRSRTRKIRRVLLPSTTERRWEKIKSTTQQERLKAHGKFSHRGPLFRTPQGWGEVARFWGEILACWGLERQQPKEPSLRLNLTRNVCRHSIEEEGKKTLKASPLRLIDFPLWFSAKSFFSAGKSEEKEKIWKVILTLLQRNFHDDTRAQPSFYVEGKFSTSAFVSFPRIFQGNSSSADADCGKRWEISSRKNIENSDRGKLLTCITEFPF